jgi:hypothetical protein
LNKEVYLFRRVSACGWRGEGDEREMKGREETRAQEMEKPKKH